MARKFYGSTARTTMTPPATAQRRPCAKCAASPKPVPAKPAKPTPTKASAASAPAPSASEVEALDEAIDEGLAEDGFYNAIRRHPHPYDSAAVAALLTKLDEARVKALGTCFVEL